VFAPIEGERRTVRPRAATECSTERVCPRVVPKGRADRDRHGQTPHARARGACGCRSEREEGADQKLGARNGVGSVRPAPQTGNRPARQDPCPWLTCDRRCAGSAGYCKRPAGAARTQEMLLRSSWRSASSPPQFARSSDGIRGAEAEERPVPSGAWELRQELQTSGPGQVDVRCNNEASVVLSGSGEALG
jgi:hypothetical protein